MLDTFEILTTSGVVVWSRTFSSVNPSIINSFISNVFIEESDRAAFTSADSSSASANAAYRRDQHTLKWAFVKELGVIFVAVYRSLLHLSWVEKLVDNIKTIFVSLYAQQLKKPHTTVVECTNFDDYFDQQLQELDKYSATDAIPLDDASKSLAPLPPGLTYRGRQLNNGPQSQEATSNNDSTPAMTPVASRPSTPASGNLIVGKPGPVSKMSRRARKARKTASSAPASSGEETSGSKQRKGGKVPKKGRKWDVDGFADEDGGADVQLDYSAQPSRTSDSEREASSAAVDAIDVSTWASSSGGKFALRDLGDEVHDMLASAEARNNNNNNNKAMGDGGLLGSVSGLFRNWVGGKTLSKEELQKAMKGMEEHLLSKNVAREAAVRLCDGVERELTGVKTASFEGVNSKIKSAMESSLTKMLTPTSSLDLLREIDSTCSSQKRPYVMSIVGVNGVGKSTNLSKICFFLLQNKYKVLVVAADTFRSGAVEQLAVHVRNLKELTAREGGHVDLFQKGYGKDAAAVAKEAVAHATAQAYHVVLIDTAGRRHNDQRLMSSLDKFAKFAQPDKILMVGEALVGTDSVAQARNFNAAFGAPRTLDGFIISKCDTVGDMVGTLVSLIHATNVPVLFVGVGQHYSDLRNFSVSWAVEKLMAP
ncbi:signal sequence receptor alpha subunit [Ophiocordyceps camponoti-floridani]|uniref:Signal recognition particle receptor subunit alpha homolog n=1 Tax=Ophiocordyceps camponoti-floridani TaxID=2030778 RepID=A0A8H4VGQ4_9HYPO|nr:signal sequence receptor alpha subunit [Ophiocordyceps camponoti-floridani]